MINKIKRLDYKKVFMILLFILLLSLLFMSVAHAAGKGDVSGAVESTWNTGKTQIKSVCNKVIFPCIDLILAVAFFTKTAMSYFDYKKQGQFDWVAPAILFASLVFMLTAPLYIWGIIGM